MADLSPAELQRYLGGIDYPAQKQDLVTQARNQNAPSEVMDFLEQIPDQSYDSPTEITSHMSE